MKRTTHITKRAPVKHFSTTTDRTSELRQYGHTNRIKSEISTDPIGHIGSVGKPNSHHLWMSDTQGKHSTFLPFKSGNLPQNFLHLISSSSQMRRHAGWRRAIDWIPAFKRLLSFPLLLHSFRLDGADASSVLLCLIALLLCVRVFVTCVFFCMLAYSMLWTCWAFWYDLLLW